MSFCPQCGAANPDGNMFCESCGSKLQAAQAPVQPVQEASQPVQEAPQPQPVQQAQPFSVQEPPQYSQSAQQYAQQPAQQQFAQQPAQQQFAQQPAQQQFAQQPAFEAPAAPQPEARPVAQLKTNRSFAKMFFLSIITLGIYGLVQMYGITEDVNTVCTRYDNKKSMNYILVILLTPVTLGILPIVWIHNLCNRMGDELKRRNLPLDFAAKDFWIFAFLLSFTIVCPIIFCVKLIKASNLLNEDFNKVG